MNGRVVADTSAFYALVSDADEFHQRATGIYADLTDQRAEVYTTSYVLVECMALIQRRLGFSALDRFVDWAKDAIIVLWIDERSHRSAWEIMKTREGKGLSFVDCTVLVLARSLTAKVFAFDQGFTREGLEVLG